MLTSEIMGAALLGLSWLTALMIALDALIDARAINRRLLAWKTHLIQGTVVAPELAVHEVEQRVKQLDVSSPALVFFDRRHVSTLKGGDVTVNGQLVNVVGEGEPEVWIDEGTRLAAAQCPSPSAFDAMDMAAQGAGGGLRTVRTSIRSGDAVWLEGKRQGQQYVTRLVSNFDPRIWARLRLTSISGLIALNFGWVFLGTVMALWPPLYGYTSVAGALVLLGHFLGMTPVAMAAREKSRFPAWAFIRGTWHRGQTIVTERLA